MTNHFTKTVISNILIIAAFLGTAKFSISQQTFKTSFDVKQIERVVKSLFKDKQYLDAINYLQFKLETIATDNQKVPLQLLLIEAHIGAGNLTVARDLTTYLKETVVNTQYEIDYKMISEKLRKFDEILSMTDESGLEQRAGYRVQILSTRNKQEAVEVKEIIKQFFPDLGIYVSYEAPFYKVRLGDFTDRDLAYDQKEACIDRGFDNAWIVKDQVLIARPDSQTGIEGIPSIVPGFIDESTSIFDEGNQPLITNSFYEMDVRQVLADITLETGIPILWDESVKGLVTLESEDMPLLSLLNAVLHPLGFSYSYLDGKFFVGSPGPENVSFGLISETEVVNLSNISATSVVRLLSEHFLPYVKADKESNLLCISAPGNLLDRIKSDVEAMDRPQEQVLIEVVITEIAKDRLREIGIDWTLTPSVTEPKWSAGTQYPENLDANIIGSYIDQGFKLGDDYVDIVASLEALMETGDAKIRANPRVTTMNARKATISITRDQYFVIQTGGSSQYSQYSTLQAVSSGISLEITPFISSSGHITMFVKPEVGDVVGEGSGGLPEISKRAAETSVRVMDGETFTIGGLSLQQRNITKRKIPILGEIPLLGYFFRYEKAENLDTEIVIFITPHILDQ